MIATDGATHTPAYDLLLSGGHVIDPANGLSTRRDVAISGGRIAAVAEGIPVERAARAVDVSGLYVVPGLIDMHVHVAPNFDISLPADAHSLSGGVTTAVDAGSIGAANFSAFKEAVVDRARVRVLAYLNIVDLGMGGEFEQETAHMDPERTAEVAAAYPGLIVGIKTAHYWTTQPFDATHAPWTSVDRAVRAGELAGLPVMVDFWPRPPERPYEELILQRLRPNDIHTHVFAQQFPVLLDGGRLNPAYAEARARGIIFDVGHGAASFWFRNAVPAMEQGFVPDSISTDLHLSSVNNLAVSLLHTMNKFLAMGLSLEEVVARATVAPAREIGHPELGTLTPGAEADVAVLDLQAGRFGYVDCGRAKLMGDRRLGCVLTVRAGEIAYDREGLSMPAWQDAPPEYWVCRPRRSASSMAFDKTPSPERS